MTDKYILFLTTAQVEHGRWSKDMRTKFILGTVNALTPLLENSVHLTIKLHPTENIDDYNEILNLVGENISLCKDIMLTDALKETDLVLVSGYSTAILEVAAFKKPVLLLNIFNEIEGIPFVDMGIAKGIYNLDDLLESTKELLYNQSARAILLKRAGRFFASNKEFVDGKAAERISDLVMRLAHGGTK